MEEIQLSQEWTLRKKYIFRVAERLEEPRCSELVRKYLGHSEWEALLLSEEERAFKLKLKPTKGPALSLRLGIYHESKLIGFTYGWQLDEYSYYMAASLILPEYQRQGLYSELLKYTIEFTRAKGFQTITSKHKATNNAVIIPKLKAGFLITGLELSDIMGTMIGLTYLHNSHRRDLLNARAGFKPPTERVRPLLG
ncbi:MAG: GNAT family N-acetyltransferase [Bdellovibrionales bacterium]